MRSPTETPDDAHRSAMDRRVRQAARILGLRIREYVSEASRESRLHDADIHAVGILREADRQGRPVTAGDLARELSLSAAAVTALIGRMERAGHVVRHRSTRDGRSVTVQVTESAYDMSNAMFDPLVEAYSEVLGDYDDDQLALVAEALERLAGRTREQARALHARHLPTPDSTDPSPATDEGSDGGVTARRRPAP